MPQNLESWDYTYKKRNKIKKMELGVKELRNRIR